ncbi:MAG: WecB/TagA/CpsF family glycosyltransferase, partial [Firmicutes bacterium]|nr:WecB/TagA/CpsF family glycosyltransferase [Bacillota bacterium]
MSKSSFPKLNVLGIDVDKVNRAGAIEAFRGFMTTEGTDMIVTPNPEIILNATKDAELRGILETASLVIPDGIGLVYASRILKDPLEERLTGVDFLSDILSLSAENGW